MWRIILWSLGLLYVFGAAGWILQAGVVRETKVSDTTGDVTLLNVACDPTRELWQDINPRFTSQYLKETGRSVTIKQSHGGSGSQARSVVDGLNADVITLALWTDTDLVRKAGLMDEKWESKLPNRSLPYVSTIVFVVRKGNPKNIKDWPDLIREGVDVISPNPKTSGNGKWSFLAAWGSVLSRGGSEEDARKYVTGLFQHIKVLDAAARGATMTFAQNHIGDVHLTWENEAYLEVKEQQGKGNWELEIVYPPLSVLAEPHVAVVDKNARQKGTEKIAQEYMKFLYTEEAQEVIAKHYYRPTNEAVKKKTADRFPELKLFPVTIVGPTWDGIQKRFFAENGEYDQLLAAGRKK
ncbi:sulfate ABC transporter substrate-binding protein [Zavarzinella formosa]|uniref:sulfate ABC transporter substrate-binding protein n=1 Tax=Zavarzinella formosa TaxID=360055 RepID=UPI0002F2FE7C|nr:sulfate ABC transporter substrate-binding protein [Zavarzinella formosa]